MRRKEREVKELSEILNIINKCKIIRLGFNDKGKIYIVPVNFGYDVINEKFLFFFHGAKAGRKYELIKQSDYIAYEMDCDYELKEADEACKYSAYYSSIIGEGIVTELKDNEKKKKALNCIMKNATGKEDWNFPKIMLNIVGVFKIEVSNLSCKQNRIK